MRIKYNRVSTLAQTGNRFQDDKEKYDLVLLDKVSGKVPFKEREGGKKIWKLVEEGKITEIVFTELSRSGRDTQDVIKTMSYLDDHNVAVVIQNLGIRSIQDGAKNPMFKLMTSIMSSIAELELENIKERIQAGRAVYQANGGIWGRPCGTNESEKKFMEKQQIKKVVSQLEKGMSIMNTSKITGISHMTILKAKKILDKRKNLEKIHNTI
jgi:DNA invertase Pin-like site-specific DNA recombinase